MKNLILLAIMVWCGAVQAEFITVTSRTQGPNFTQFFTGDRYKVFAQLDTSLRLLRISAWEYGDPPEYLWHRDYPLSNQAELMQANRAMAQTELTYDFSSFVTLQEGTCTALFFPVLSDETVELDRNVAKIVGRLQGDSNDLSIQHLLNVNTKCYGTIRVGAVLNKQNEFVKFALVSGDRKALKGMSIETQNGRFFIKRNGVPIIRILKENFGRKSGGNFSVHVSPDCSGQNFALYNFSVGKVQGKWKLTSFTPLDGVISLVMDREPEISVAQDFIEAPVELGLGILDGIFGTLVWAFIPNDTKKEIIYDKVLDQARANPTIKENFTDQEIQALSRRIANNNPLRWFAPFTGQGSVKKAAYLEFATALMRKLARKSLPEGASNDEADRIMYLTTKDLQACLKDAGEQDEFDTCMAKFTRSGPYRLGRELMLAHLVPKLKSQNLTDDEQKAVNAKSLKEYNRCAQNEYFRRYDEKIKTAYANRKKNKQKTNLMKVSDEFDGNAVIQACLFSAINEGAESALITIVEKSVKENIQSPATRARQAAGLKEEYKTCIKGEDLYRETQGLREYDYALLKRLDPAAFEVKMSKCIDSVTISAGRQVIDASLRENASLVESTRTVPAKMDAIVKITLEQGYESCLAKQKSPKPTQCLPLVEAIAAQQVMGLLMKDTVTKSLAGNEAETKRVLGLLGIGESENIQFNMNKCFQDRISILNERLSAGQILDNGNPAVLECIKQSILVVAPAIGLAKYNVSVAGLPAVPGVDLGSAEMKARIQSQVKSCFEAGLQSVPNISELGSSLTLITNNCTLALFQEVVPSIVQDVLKVKVSDAVKDEYAQKRILYELDKRFRNKVMVQTEPAAIMELVDGFTLEATFYVLEEALKESVKSAVPGDSKTFTTTLLTTVLTQERREAITTAVTTVNNKKLSEVIAQIKKDAGTLILEHSIPLKIAENVKEEKTRKAITAQVSKSYKGCLAKIPVSAKDFDVKFDKCNVNAANEATISVFRVNLDQVLEKEFPTYGQSSGTKEFNRKKHARIRAKVMDGEFYKSVREINANGGGGFDLTLLTLQFKAKAAIEIAKEYFVLW